MFLAKLLAFLDRRAGFDFENLRLVAGGDEARRVSQDRNHADRQAAQLGPLLLLAAREVAVHIDEGEIARHNRNTASAERSSWNS
jgi:hypothetical protein